MNNLLKNLSESTKGYMLMIAGAILLLHTLKVLEQWLTYILIAGSLFMIVYGFIQAGLLDKMLKALKKDNSKR